MSYNPKANILTSLFELKPLLMQRGLDLSSSGEINQTLFGKINEKEKIGVDKFFEMMDLNENRKRIRKSIFDENSSIEISGYTFSIKKDEERYFTSAFEWYVSQLLIREFSFFASGFNNNIKRTNNGEDFDVLGFGLDVFTHIECKTGNPQNITKEQIINFKSKCNFIAADINIFYIDYNGLSVDSHEILKWFPEIFFDSEESPLFKISKTQTSFEIYKVDIAPVYIVDTNKNSKSVVDNLREVFNVFFKIKFQENLSAGIEPEFLEEYGYSVQKLKK